MQSEVNKLIGKHFGYKSRIYYCKNAKIVSGMAVLITDRHTLNFYKKEFDEFLEEIFFVHSEESNFTSSEIISQSDKESLIAEKKKNSEFITASVIKNFSMNEQITGKLMDVFNQIDENPTDEVIKKASAMVMASNAIVSVQASQYKLLTLRK